MLFLCRCNAFHVIFYLDDILVLTCSKNAGRQLKLLLLCIGSSWTIYKFSKSELISHAGLDMTLSLPSDKCIEIQQLAHALSH